MNSDIESVMNIPKLGSYKNITADNMMADSSSDFILHIDVKYIAYTHKNILIDIDKESNL